MKNRIRSVGLGVVACLQVWMANPATASGLYTDELSKCFMRSTTDVDRTLLAQWLFAAMAFHPAVKAMACVTDGQRADLDKSTAAMIDRLLTRSCASETRDALKYEGHEALVGSFKVFGEVAGRELFSHPDVAKAYAQMSKHLDTEALKKVLAPEK